MAALPRKVEANPLTSSSNCSLMASTASAETRMWVSSRSWMIKCLSSSIWRMSCLTGGSLSRGWGGKGGECEGQMLFRITQISLLSCLSARVYAEGQNRQASTHVVIKTPGWTDRCDGGVIRWDQREQAADKGAASKERGWSHSHP